MVVRIPTYPPTRGSLVPVIFWARQIYRVYEYDTKWCCRACAGFLYNKHFCGTTFCDSCMIFVRTYAFPRGDLQDICMASTSVAAVAHWSCYTIYGSRSDWFMICLRTSIAYVRNPAVVVLRNCSPVSWTCFVTVLVFTSRYTRSETKTKLPPLWA